MSFKSSSEVFTVGCTYMKNARINQELWRRCFSSTSEDPSFKLSKSKLFQQPPLSESLPDLSKVVYSTYKDDQQTTRITKLSNGIRVASENWFGEFCTVGVVIDAGSRYEARQMLGISHFLEKLAFQSSTKYENKDIILKKIEGYGGLCDCQSTRDAFIYAASVERKGLDPVIDIIADVVLRPRITEEEVLQAQETIKYELDSLNTKPEQDLKLTDMIHAAAFRDNTVGLPKLCPASTLYHIDRNTLFTFLNYYYDPSRIVVAGVGVDHQELVNSVQKYFVDLKPVWEEDPSLIKTDRKYRVDLSVAQYTGGIIIEECEIPQFVGPSGLPELAHVVIGLEGTSFNHEDFVPLCVLNMMMGGGGSFSAGGPGKGMFTRLYTNVLNRHHWLFSATAYNHSYADTGLFCIHASATPNYVPNIVEVLIKEMVAMGRDVKNEELSRAKKQLQSMLLMNLEARPVVFEDIGRQVLANGFRKRPEEFIKLIEYVTTDDIIRVARRLLSSPPSVAARGNVAKIQSIDDIRGGLRDPNGTLPRKIRSFFY